MDFCFVLLPNPLALSLQLPTRLELLDTVSHTSIHVAARAFCKLLLFSVFTAAGMQPTSAPNALENHWRAVKQSAALQFSHEDQDNIKT
jgi:hypothetical protein